MGDKTGGYGRVGVDSRYCEHDVGDMVGVGGGSRSNRSGAAGGSGRRQQDYSRCRLGRITVAAVLSRT